MAYLWKKDALNRALNGEVYGIQSEGIHDIVIDSRAAVKGAIFFCIKGENFDGHDFAYEAYQKGALMVVIDTEHRHIFDDYVDKDKICYIVVKDVLAALYRLAKASRIRSKAKIVAITGSVGKTTTKELLRHVLFSSAKIHASPASFNNHWGVPLTLARMPEDTNFGIFEIGMSHKGEIRALAALIAPHIGIITKIAPSHLANFKHIEDIVFAKAELFESIGEDGVILLNQDDTYYGLLKRCAEQKSKAIIKTFGYKSDADYRLLDIKSERDGSVLTILIHNKKAIFYLNLLGEHNCLNSLAVIGILDNLNLDVIPYLSHFALFEPVKGRGRRYDLAFSKSKNFQDIMPLTLFDESYNANPTSMEAALSLLTPNEGSETRGYIVILGDMLELGQASETYHRLLAKKVSALKLEQLFLIGKNMRFLQEELTGKLPILWKENAEEMRLALIHYLEKNFYKDQKITLMIKSSHSIESFKIVQYLLEHYPLID